MPNMQLLNFNNGLLFSVFYPCKKGVLIGQNKQFEDVTSFYGGPQVSQK